MVEMDKHDRFMDDIAVMSPPPYVQIWPINSIQMALWTLRTPAQHYRVFREFATVGFKARVIGKRAFAAIFPCGCLYYMGATGAIGRMLASFAQFPDTGVLYFVVAPLVVLICLMAASEIVMFSGVLHGLWNRLRNVPPLYSAAQMNQMVSRDFFVEK